MGGGAWFTSVISWIWAGGSRTVVLTFRGNSAGRRNELTGIS